MAAGESGRRSIVAWFLAYLALLLVVWAAYGATLKQFFVADDFTNLLYVRSLKAPLWGYLSPTFGYSEPVTSSRYLPLKLFIVWLCERIFGLDATAHHAVALLVHALDALLVGYLAYTLYRDRTIASLTALLFATSRVNAQNVCWVVCLPNLVGATLAFASTALYLQRREGVRSWGAGPLLLFASLLCRPDAVTAVAFLAPLWVKDGLLEKRRSAIQFAAASSVLTALFLVLTWISLRSFPEPHLDLGFSPHRFYAFFANLFAPWQAADGAKAAVVIAVVAAAAALRDARVYYALFGIAVGALLWTVVVYLKLTPRYLYVYTALSSMVLAVLLRRAGGERAALAAGLLFCAWNAWQVRRQDVVWFDYLSISGRALMRLHEQQRAAGATAPLRARMDPHVVLINSDLAFFRPYVEVVKDGPADVTVDTGHARFVTYYGADFGKAFWYFPWFVQ